jgi:hypothetical protein
MFATTTTTTGARVARLAGLLRREREAIAEFLVELSAFHAQRCWEELGYPSLFDFLTRELRLSRGNAFYRVKAVELAQRFPEVIGHLQAGELCITSIVELARVLTVENRANVLPRFFHVSRQEAKELSAELAPREVVPIREIVTAPRAPAQVETPTKDASAVPAEASPSVDPRAPVQLLNSVAAKAVDRSGDTHAEARRELVDPLTGGLSRLHLTVSRELLAKLEAARLALSHSRPAATIADLLELGADAALAKDAKRKALVSKPRPARQAAAQAPAESGYVPAEIRRAVWRRDGGCCQWPVASGGICGSRLRAQLDHIIPRGMGGPSTIDNLRVLCERHNKLAARRAYGDVIMDRYVRGKRPSSAPLSLPSAP